MTTMAQAVAAAVKRGRTTEAYLGQIVSVNAAEGSLTVDIYTGTPITGVRWGAPFATGAVPPVVNEFVTVFQVGWAWVVMARLSKDLRGGTPPPIQGVVTASPTASFSGLRPASTWQWSTYDATDGLRQGRSAGGVVMAGVSVFPNLAAMLPEGATVTSGKVRAFRLAPGGSGSGGAALVSPAFYGHAYSGSPAGAPSWTTTVWRPGRVAEGQAAQWDLPSAWLTALLAGTMRGLGIYSTAAADWSYWTPPTLTITYTTPA